MTMHTNVWNFICGCSIEYEVPLEADGRVKKDPGTGEFVSADTGKMVAVHHRCPDHATAAMQDANALRAVLVAESRAHEAAVWALLGVHGLDDFRGVLADLGVEQEDEAAAVIADLRLDESDPASAAIADRIRAGFDRLDFAVAVAEASGGSRQMLIDRFVPVRARFTPARELEVWIEGRNTTAAEKKAVTDAVRAGGFAVPLKVR